MKNNELMSMEEWIERHKNDIQNINNIMKDLEKDKRIQKIYKRFIKEKSKNNKISYNTEKKLSKEFRKATLLSSYSKKGKIKKDDFKLGQDNSQMIFG